tara:strand:- start:80 stop:1249 length:1170 start_codon:yes stop_codon:yes gene_type:complete
MAFAVTSYSDGAVGILSAKIISLDQTLNLPNQGTQLDTDESRYELFRSPAEKIDKNILSKFVDPINAAKQIIVNNGDKSVWSANEQVYSSTSLAISALNTLYGEITDQDGVYSDRQVLTVLNFNGTPASGIGTLATPANPPAGSASVDAAVVQGDISGKLDFAVSTTAGVTGRAIVRDVTGGDFTTGTPGAVGPPSLGVGTITIGGAEYYATSIEYIGLGNIYNDIDVFTFYPNLEPPDPNQENIFGNRSTVIVDTSNAGNGIANTFFSNGLSTSTDAPTPIIGEFVQTSTSIPTIGEVYTFNTTSGSSQVSNINAQQQIIKDLRFGVVSNSSDVGVGSFDAAAVVVKTNKKGFAVNTWSGKRMRVVAANDKTGYETAIQILSDPSYQS